MISFITQKLSVLGPQGLVDRLFPLSQAGSTRLRHPQIASNEAIEVYHVALGARFFR